MAVPKVMSVMDQVTEHPYRSRCLSFGDDFGIDRSDIKYIDAVKTSLTKSNAISIDSSDIYISVARLARWP